MTSERLSTLTSWHADWKGLRVAVLGLSVTGFSVADTLAELGADVLVVTEKADEEYERLLPVIGARLWTGPPRHACPHELVDFAPEVVVASPGFAPRHPVIVVGAGERRRALGRRRARLARARQGACAPTARPPTGSSITGTNGKTTTTRLTATMLVAGGLRAAPVGNIGTPVLDAVRDPAGFDALVVELSSHQLWYLGLQDAPDPLSPHAACASTSPTTTSSGTARSTPTATRRRTCTTTRASRASTTRRMPRPSAWSRTPRSSRARARSASISACPVRATSGSSTASSSIAPSSTTGARARSS